MIVARPVQRPVAEAVPAAEVLRAFFLHEAPVTPDAAVEAALVLLAHPSGALPPPVLQNVAGPIPEPSRTLWFWYHACTGIDLGRPDFARSGLPEDVLPVLLWCWRHGLGKYVEARDRVDEYAQSLRQLDGHAAAYPSFVEAVLAARRGVTDAARLLGQLPGGWDNPGTRAGGGRLLRDSVALRAGLIADGLDPDMPVAPLPRRLGRSAAEQQLCRRLLTGLPGVRAAAGSVRSWTDLLSTIDPADHAPWQALLHHAGLVSHAPEVQAWRTHLRSGRPVPQERLVLSGVEDTHPVWALSAARDTADSELQRALCLAAVRVARVHGLASAEVLLTDALVGLAARGRSVAWMIRDWRSSCEHRLQRVAERVLTSEWRHVADPALWLSVLHDDLIAFCAALDEPFLAEGVVT